MSQSHDAMVARIVGEYRNPTIYVLCGTTKDDEYVGQFWPLMKILYLDYENYYMSTDADFGLNLYEYREQAGNNWIRNENCRDILIRCILRRDIEISLGCVNEDTCGQDVLSLYDLRERIRENQI